MVYAVFTVFVCDDIFFVRFHRIVFFRWFLMKQKRLRDAITEKKIEKKREKKYRRKGKKEF